MSKLIILGKGGMLGNYLFSYLKNKFAVIGLDRSHFDFKNKTFKEIYAFILSQLKSDLTNSEEIILINAVGIIPRANVDDNADFFEINSHLPHTLSIICNINGWKYIHPSTDCVFDGRKGSYTEDDEPTEKGLYGLSKCMGEPTYGAIIRTSIIGEELYHKYSLLEWVKSHKNETLKGYDDHLWNGITCLQYAKIIEEIINKKLWWVGVRHIYSEPTTKYELVKMINEIYELGNVVEKFNTGTLTDKTLSSKYEQIFNIPKLYDQIKELKNYSF